MKKFQTMALVCLFVVAAASTGCSDDDLALLPGISLGSVDASTNGEEIADGIETECGYGDGCDGILQTPAISGASVKEFNDDVADFNDLDDDDAETLFVMLFAPAFSDPLDTDDIENADDFDDAVADLTEPTEMTFNITRTTNCNSTGGSDGDALGGIIREALVLTAEFDDMGIVGNSDIDAQYIVTFANCLFEGNLLSQPLPVGDGVTHTTAIRLNGGYALDYVRPDGTISPTNAEVASLKGTVLLSTDADGDGVFGNEFWTNIVTFDGEDIWDDDVVPSNGGACAGGLIDFGPDDEDDGDDDCADGGEVFIPASDVVEALELDNFWSFFY
ncbi:MAG: hypothetical protein KDH09_00225 [Chrysiogenetes bacterium]|nr:hypothetical protein [Chrysiogenetes bacterium]